MLYPYIAVLFAGNKNTTTTTTTTKMCDYKSEVKGGKQGYFSFLGTATLSEAIKPALVASYICGCHIGTTNKYAPSRHETATMISSFGE